MAKKKPVIKLGPREVDALMFLGWSDYAPTARGKGWLMKVGRGWDFYYSSRLPQGGRGAVSRRALPARMIPKFERMGVLLDKGYGPWIGPEGTTWTAAYDIDAKLAGKLYNEARKQRR